MSLKVAELFNQRRIDRCIDMSNRLMSHWKERKRFEYIVRSESPTEGVSLEQLVPMTFQVGVPGYTVDMSFIDLLVVFHSVKGQRDALNARKNNPQLATFRYVLPTEFSESEAMDTFLSIHVEQGMDTDTARHTEE